MGTTKTSVFIMLAPAQSSEGDPICNTKFDADRRRISLLIGRTLGDLTGTAYPSTNGVAKWARKPLFYVLS